MSKYCVVIRSIGERTEPIAERLLAEECQQKVFITQQPSVSAALRDAHQIAVNADADIFISCDADVIPFRGAVHRLIAVHEVVPSSFLTIVPWVEDFLFPRTRLGGIRLYRTEVLAKALTELDAQELVRPDSGLIAPMAHLGHPSAICGAVVGLHDSEQYFRDILRKTAFWSVKHRSDLQDLMAFWLRKEPETADYRVALIGASLGLSGVMNSGNLTNVCGEAVDKALELFEVTEKNPLSSSDMERQLASLKATYGVKRWSTIPFKRGFAGVWGSHSSKPSLSVAGIVRSTGRGLVGKAQGLS